MVTFEHYRSSTNWISRINVHHGGVSLIRFTQYCTAIFSVMDCTHIHTRMYSTLCKPHHRCISYNEQTYMYMRVCVLHCIHTHIHTHIDIRSYMYAIVGSKFLDSTHVTGNKHNIIDLKIHCAKGRFRLILLYQFIHTHLRLLLSSLMILAYLEWWW